MSKRNLPVVGRKNATMLSVKEAAIIMDVSTSCVSNWVATGKLPAVKVTGEKSYYIYIDELNKFAQTKRPYNKKKEKEEAKTISPAEAMIESLNRKQQELLLEASAAMIHLLEITPEVDKKQFFMKIFSDICDDRTRKMMLNAIPEFAAEISQ